MTKAKVENELTNTLIGKEVAFQTIIELLKKTAESQFEIGTVLLGCKNAIESQKTQKAKDYAKAEYASLIEKLPFGEKVANKFIQIAKDKMIKKYLDIAPVAYNTLYEMVNLSEDQWEFFKEKNIGAYTTSKEISNLKKEYQEKTATPDKEETVDASSGEVVELPTTGMKTDAIDGSDFNVDEEVTDEVMFDGLAEYLVVSVDAANVSAKDLQKLDDLVAYIKKLNFKSNTVSVEIYNEVLMKNAA